MTTTARRASGLGGPLLVSVLLHGTAIVALVLWKAADVIDLPPLYRVDLIAAPPGERAAGVVRTPPPVTPPVPSEAPARAATNATEAIAPIKTPTEAVRPTTRATTNITEVPTKTKVTTAPTAGGGVVGGPGTDVANVRIEGIDFPFPGYLQNIIRQIAINFKPRNPGALTGEVFFMIRRDGTVTGFRFVKRSGNYGFDLEAQGAVEAATAGFGPLPAGFANDILPVNFKFDPARLR